MKPHLILDQDSVAEAHGVGFRLNPAQKYGGNPVLSPGRPYDWDGLQVEWPGTVLYDPVEGIYKCWYSGFEALQHPGRKWRFGYAESPDGVTWSKPRLGQVEYRGEPTNQIAEPPGTFAMSTVFLDPSARDGEYRFLGLWVRTGGDTWTHRKVIARSKDGIEWETGDPIWDGFYDVSQVLFDPDDPDPNKRVKMYAQAHYYPADLAAGATRPDRPGNFDLVRAIAFLHGKDLESIVEPELPLALAPEPDIDDELHFAGVQKIGGTYLMLYESDQLRHGSHQRRSTARGQRQRPAVPARAPAWGVRPDGAEGRLGRRVARDHDRRHGRGR